MISFLENFGEQGGGVGRLETLRNRGDVNILVVASLQERQQKDKGQRETDH